MSTFEEDKPRTIQSFEECGFSYIHKKKCYRKMVQTDSLRAKLVFDFFQENFALRVNRYHGENYFLEKIRGIFQTSDALSRFIDLICLSYQLDRYIGSFFFSNSQAESVQNFSLGARGIKSNFLISRKTKMFKRSFVLYERINDKDRFRLEKRLDNEDILFVYESSFRLIKQLDNEDISLLYENNFEEIKRREEKAKVKSKPSL